MSWTKVDREKEDWNKVDKTEGWFKTGWFFDWFGKAFDWEKVEKEKEDWNKVDRSD